MFSLPFLIKENRLLLIRFLNVHLLTYISLLTVFALNLCLKRGFRDIHSLETLEYYLEVCVWCTVERVRESIERRGSMREFGVWVLG